MKLKLFWQENCPNCPVAKDLIKNVDSIQIESFDIDSVDGMTEAAFHAVMSTPSIVIVDNDDKEIAAWRTEMPTLNDINEISLMPN